MGVQLARLKDVAADEIRVGTFASDESIARKAGITYRTYQTAKKGHSVSVSTGNKIAKALRCKLPDLQAKSGDGNSVTDLVMLLWNQPWHQRCEIIPDYMPPFPNKDTRPKVAIKYHDGTEHPPFLRYSAGPRQGFFWDVYGDDFHSVELAIIAMSQAPAPVDVGPVVYKFPLKAEA